MFRRIRTSIFALIVAVAAVPVVLFAIASPAGAVAVTSEAELDAAFSDPSITTIFLTQSIALTCAVGELERNEDTNALVVEGAEPFTTITQTCPDNRVASQAGTAPIEFNGVNLEGGATTSGGGAIKSAGDVTLTSSFVVGNRATDSSGGAVQSAGTINIIHSVLHDNQATGGGSGGALDAEGSVSVTNSTLADNDAGDTGGAIRSHGTVSITSSLLAGNSTEGDTGGGGAVDAGQGGPIDLVNATVTGNSAGSQFGGGLLGGDINLVYSDVVSNTAADGANMAWEGELESFGSVVALPLGGGENCFFAGASTSAGYNFSDDSSCGFTAGGDRQNAGDPLLGALISAPPGTLCFDYGCNSGGFALQPGSPLLDAIPPAHCEDDGAAGVTTDVFGTTRPQGSGCEIGAVEMPAAPPAPPEPPVVEPRFTG